MVKSFVLKKTKEVKLSGWGAEFGAVEKVFFDSSLPTEHCSSGITICTSSKKSRIPLHYHNCETFHYVLYGCGVMRDSSGKAHRIRPGDAIYCGKGPEGSHSIENLDEFPLAILWVHAYPKGRRENTTWIKEK